MSEGASVNAFRYLYIPPRLFPPELLRSGLRHKVTKNIYKDNKANRDNRADNPGERIRLIDNGVGGDVVAWRASLSRGRKLLRPYREGAMEAGRH